jgi:hypothetical protein
MDGHISGQVDRQLDTKTSRQNNGWANKGTGGQTNG